MTLFVSTFLMVSDKIISMKKYKKYIIAFLVLWLGYTIIFNRELDLFGLNWFWALIPLGLLWLGVLYYIKKEKEKVVEEEEKANIMETTFSFLSWILGSIIFFIILDYLF